LSRAPPDHVGGLARADEERALLPEVGERHRLDVEADVVVVRQVLQDRPVLLQRIVRVVAVHQAELDRLGRDERVADAEFFHRADRVVVVDLAGRAVAAGSAVARARGEAEGEHGGRADGEWFGWELHDSSAVRTSMFTGCD
jgi:hypothetical protein